MIFTKPIRSIDIFMGEININVEHNGDVTIIEMVGELDSVSSPMAQEEILPFVQQGCKILLDMSNVTYMSSAGLRTLLLLYRQIQNHAGTVVITGLGEEVRDVMSITGFLDFFHTVTDRHEGIRFLG